MGKSPQEEGGINRPPFAIELKNVCKSFGTVQANKDICLQVEQGTIHGIVGENGAGKSTLMNILYGLHQADSGEISIKGEEVEINSSADAINLGIGMVHQHFMLVPNFTVLENVMLGSEGAVLLKEGEAAARNTLKELGEKFGLTVDPDALIEDLPVGTRQKVEIIKAIKGGAEILILDEPTGVLTPSEAKSLFEILNVLKERGVTVLLITHKLAEIMAVTDNVSIIRQGQTVGQLKTSQTDTGELAELMVGRKVLLRVERTEAKPGDVYLSAQNLNLVSKSGVKLLDNISFEIRSGEILGVAGVAGNGQTELLEIFSGMETASSGALNILGEEISTTNPKHPNEMRELGVGHIPEDRHHHGLVLNFEAQENIIFGFHREETSGKGSFLDRTSITNLCAKLMEKFDVRPQNPKLTAKNFSGGNQQKLVIAREINADPKVLIVGQPTRGVDIGAIEFIHKQLIALRDQGCAILVVSVELEEIIGLADRVMVMNSGECVGIIDSTQADERKLGLMMAGISEDTAA